MNYMAAFMSFVPSHWPIFLKTLIAIEFAYQAAEGQINPRELVPLYKLDRFDVDDQNLETWEKMVKSKGLVNSANRIKLRHIAQGMIRSNVNACADYLFSVLDIDQINERINHLDMEHHQKSSHLVPRCQWPITMIMQRKTII